MGAEGVGNLGAVHNEGFLELVVHPEQLSHGRARQADRAQQQRGYGAKRGLEAARRSGRRSRYRTRLTDQPTAVSVAGRGWSQAAGRVSWIGVDWAPMEVSGVGLKPLTISQMPRESSNAAMGSAARTATEDTLL